MPANPDQLREWRNMELTKLALEHVKAERQSWIEQSCVGATSNDSHKQAALRDGIIAGLGFVLALGVTDDDASTEGESRASRA